METILIVDDEPNILVPIEFLLTQNGFEVRKALSGAEALDALPDFMPQIVLLDVMMPGELDAAVPFYGTPAAEALRANVRGPLMLHFGGLDKRVNDTWPAYEQVLKSNGADYVAYVYEGVNHGFHNDSTGRYAPEEAELAWSRTVAFFQEHLAKDGAAGG